ncbi:MAG: alpha/beta hydrolase, partial [Actinomycetota bacterium]
MSYVLSVLGLLFTALARSAVRRPRRNRPLWVTAMAGSELAGWFFFGALGLLVGFRIAGWAGGVAGVAGQVLLALAAIAFAIAVVRGLRSNAPATAAVGEFIGEPVRLDWSRSASLLRPSPPLPHDVTVDAGVAYGPHERHVLDRIGRTADAIGRPALVYVHGGGWWRGRRNTQARPMIHRLAAAGWQVFTPSYRLSPEATYPDHLVDVKRAIAWVRTNAASLGVDPGFIAVAGGSTGGNLAALAALTADDAALQPGFEDSDVSVQACIPLYGVHDLLKDDGGPLWPYLETSVMKSTAVHDAERWRSASPIHRVSARRPPFFVVHGGSDTLVRPELSRRLVTALREAGGPPVGYLEVPWGNHGFDFFAGPRGRVTTEAIVT